jgi:hypothetical protein
MIFFFFFCKLKFILYLNLIFLLKSIFSVDFKFKRRIIHRCDSFEFESILDFFALNRVICIRYRGFFCMFKIIDIFT